jgi:hypothetical protein
MIFQLSPYARTFCYPQKDCLGPRGSSRKTTDITDFADPSIIKSLSI